MRTTHKTVALILAIAVTAFMLTREFQVWHHFVIVNRDFVPVMSYFYGQTVLHLATWLVNLAGVNIGYNVATSCVIELS